MKKQTYVLSGNESELRKVFLKSVAESGGMLFRIKSYPITERFDSKKVKPGRVAYALEEIEVSEINFNYKPGFVRVNSNQDIPLVDEEPLGKDSIYWNKETCVKVIQDLNSIELNKVKEEHEEIAAAESYLERVVSECLY
jgi:hypothetical protein